MEERIESIKNKIDDYLQNANNESDCCKKKDGLIWQRDGNNI